MSAYERIDIRRFSKSLIDRAKGRNYWARSRRTQVRIPVTLELETGVLVQATLNDLSDSGFRMASQTLLHVGQRFRMQMPERTVECELRWAEGLEAAGVFAENGEFPSWPVDPEEHPNDRGPRRVLQSKGFAVLDDGTTFGLTVVDLSYDGCKIEPGIALFPGLKLKVSIAGVGGVVEAVVRWFEDGKAGLRFAADDAPAKPEIPRRFERHEISAEISLRRAGRSHYRSRIINLTPTGCKVEFVERPKTDETLWVRFEGLEPLRAYVRWVEGFFGGLEFARPIHPAVFDLLISRLKS